MKKVIKLVVLVMASAMMMSGCGKEEKISSKDLAVQEDYGNVEQGIVQGGTEAQEDLQEATINSYEELKNYQDDRMKKFREVYESCGVEYEVTPNQCFIYGTEESYEILEKKYEIFQMTYSIYNYEQNQVNTVIDFEFEFHPDKGVASDDKYIQLLSALIHATENSELKEKFPTRDALVSEITSGIGAGEDFIVFEAGNCRLKIEVDGSAKYILEFASVENIACNIPREEPVYKEFASLDDYRAYTEADIREIVDESKYQIIEGMNGLIGLARIGENVKFVRVYVHNTETAYGIDNNFALVCDGNWYPNVPKEYMADARKVLVQSLEYLDVPVIDIEKAVDEVISYDIMYDKRIDYCVTNEWFGITPLADQYPYMYNGNVVIPIKVEGMLNR